MSFIPSLDSDIKKTQCPSSSRQTTLFEAFQKTKQNQESLVNKFIGLKSKVNDDELLLTPCNNIHSADKLLKPDINCFNGELNHDLLFSYCKNDILDKPRLSYANEHILQEPKIKKTEPISISPNSLTYQSFSSLEEKCYKPNRDTLGINKLIRKSKQALYSNKEIEHNFDCITAIPLRCRFSSGSSRGLHKASFSDESGYITIVDSKKKKSFIEHTNSSQVSIISKWKAHNNSIFNFKWTFDDSKILTSSADCTMCLWDIESNSLMSRFTGHFGTIYALDFDKNNSNIVASGGRDGSICLWDTRCASGIYSSINAIDRGPSYLLLDAHFTENVGRSPKPANKRRFLNKNTVRPTITSLQYLLNGYTICSASSQDGSISFWDTRTFTGFKTSSSSNANRSLIGQTCNPFKKSRGISSLALSPDGTMLYSSSIDNTIYIYDTLIPASPIATLKSKGLVSRGFNNEIDVNSDWLASGSSNGTIHLFDLKKIEKKLISQAKYKLSLDDNACMPCIEVCDSDILLKGHTDDTSSVQWCPWGEFDEMGVNILHSQLMSCSDDYSVRFWDSYSEKSLFDHYGHKSFESFYSNQSLAADGFGFEQHHKNNED
ncbi:hypothetical protein BB561_005750 [Smittium simulii]|uniref:Uncharacterized protein n=1 Tax=Smittium simulii TaxID=133385 RepID=A0A2T9Y8K5_9FUNG|nr:hypothetical protein BB561_005750 [Smittium simulii]